MIVLYNAINSLLYILTVLCVFCLILEYELNLSKKQLALSLVIFTIIASCLALVVDREFLMLVDVLLTLLFLILYSKSKKLSTFGAFAIINLCIFQLELNLDIIIYIVAYLIAKESINFWIIDTMISLFLFFSVGIVTLRLWKGLNTKQKIKTHHRKWFAIIEIIIFIINFILLSSEYKFALINKDPNETFFNAVIFSFIFFFFVLIGFIVYYLLITHERQKELLALNERYLKQVNLYCDSLKSKNDDLRKMKHDIRQHLYSINLLLKNGKIQEAQSYTNKFLEETAKVITISRSGSLIIDSIIEQYSSTATEHEISIILSGQLPQNIMISDYDLCIIFYNLLVNAIKECMQIEGKKKIFIGIGTYGRYINISVCNPLSISKKNFSISSKIDKENHGYGLKNVEQCVKENNGDLKIILTDSHCKIDIVLEGIKKSI